LQKQNFAASQLFPGEREKPKKPLKFPRAEVGMGFLDGFNPMGFLDN